MQRNSNKKLLGAPGLTTRSKDATRSKGHRKGIATRSKDATRGSWHRYERSILTTSVATPLVSTSWDPHSPPNGLEQFPQRSELGTKTEQKRWSIWSQTRR